MGKRTKKSAENLRRRAERAAIQENIDKKKVLLKKADRNSAKHWALRADIAGLEMERDAIRVRAKNKE